MRIDSSTIGMESARSYKASNTTARRFTIMDYQSRLNQGNQSLNAAVGGNTGNTANAEQNTSKEKAEGSGEKSVTTMQEWQTRFQSTVSNVSVRSSVSQSLMELREQTIRYIFDMLFGARRTQFGRWSQMNGFRTDDAQTGGAQSGTESTGGTNNTSNTNGNGVFDQLLASNQRPLTSSMKVLNFSHETFFAETESASFSTVGTVKTADGREISFNVNVGMSREFQQYYREDLELASFTMCDPLVINLDTDVAQLEDQTFYFDIDADGELDEISSLGAGSGYLALDKNGDGIINDGSELFGTSSGNGFADLAKYDEDGNGWIDENDEIFSKLSVWVQCGNGQAKLLSLADANVGAIFLGSRDTQFSLADSSGDVGAMARRTGIYLKETGEAGTVQHLDFKT